MDTIRMQNMMASFDWLTSLDILAAADSGVLGAVLGRLWNIFQVLVGLGFVIFIHELGHFLAAKFFGVKCEKFYVGFDVPIRIGPIQLPSNLGKFQWGETEYGIGIIPLGGYVKMLGQDDDPRNAEAEAQRIRVAGSEPTATNADARPLDPRSYPAKPVYARMVIISAGVIMNLISAVFLAAGAYMVGVPYAPTIVGSVSAGDPAWQNGIVPGDHILQVGNMARPEQRLSFEDLTHHTITYGMSDAKNPLPIQLERDGQKVSVRELVGTKSHDPSQKRLMIGITAEHTTRLAKNLVFTSDGIRAKGNTQPVSTSLDSTKLMPKDLIVGIDGTELPLDPVVKVPAARFVRSMLIENMDKNVTLQVERTIGESTSKVDVQLPPTPMRSLGLRMQIGAVTAIQTNGVAQKAGVSVGDKLIAIDDQPIDDGLTLHLLVARKIGQMISLTLEKPDAGSSAPVSRYNLTWFVPKNSNASEHNQYAPIGFELIGAGLTYGVTDLISGIEAGSQAAQTGIQIGDRITQVHLEPTSDSQKQDLRDSLSKKFLESIKIDKNFNTIWLHRSIQILPLDLPIRVHYERGGVIQECVLKVENSQNWNWIDRGLEFQPMQLIRKSDSLADAFSLGLAETGKQLMRVLGFLYLIITGNISLFDLGGPGVIFYVASSAASQGVTTLLIFLTMLSANLAILNFLPIPALDGGHMVFLAAEAARGKSVDENLQMRLTMAGVLSLLALMAFVLVNDVIRLWPQ